MLTMVCPPLALSSEMITALDSQAEAASVHPQQCDSERACILLRSQAHSSHILR